MVPDTRHMIYTNQTPGTWLVCLTQTKFQAYLWLVHFTKSNSRHMIGSFYIISTFRSTCTMIGFSVFVDLTKDNVELPHATTKQGYKG